jgi:DNA-nicking Smr family endonuclease
MSRDRNDTPRPRRPLSSDERKLWTGVTRSVVPLRRKPPAAPVVPIPGLAGDGAPPAPVRPRAEVPRPTPVSPAPKPAPSAGLLDRRLKRRLARGAEPIDARIDLHGRKLADAHIALLHFLRRAQADGARFALVITGKGSTASSTADLHVHERGALRRQVPLWLALPEFRAYVLAAEEAHPGHGGAGALYVRLRRTHPGRA